MLQLIHRCVPDMKYCKVICGHVFGYYMFHSCNSILVADCKLSFLLILLFIRSCNMGGITYGYCASFLFLVLF